MKENSDRYAWHACWHDDAWRGIEFLPPDVVGVYWRIILLMYRRRSALLDDDETMAMACFTSVKAYRSAKQRLLDAGRVEVDDAAGLIFCPRAVKQLVKDDRFRETQGRRGKKGGRPKSEKLARDFAATSSRLHGDLKPTSSRDEGGLHGVLGAKKQGPFSGDKSARFAQNQRLTESGKKTPAKATHTHIGKSPKSELYPGAKNDLEARRSPHESGGAHQQRARKKWLADQRKRLGVAPDKPKKGKE